MTFIPFEPRRFAINEAAISWISTFNLTHALTLTYPVPKTARGHVDRYDGKTGELVETIPAASLKRNSTPLWTSSSILRLRKNLRNLHAMVDGALFSKRFHTKPLSTRTSYFAFPSGIKIDSMLHVHMAWSVPEAKINAFESLFPDNKPVTCWNKLVQAGTHKLERIYDTYGWLQYCTKQSPFVLTILSPELIPEKK
ncbi:hypothetical protein HNP71_000706 [Acidocella aromatica]|uniref:Uncharacterized protein n=1 Tax=Acidocella aromatica TaxID=1303579 RepID=A0A840V926_9PROT|nr:hypothetical protein [Acidocella aromatica]